MKCPICDAEKFLSSLEEELRPPAETPPKEEPQGRVKETSWKTQAYHS